MCGIVGYLGDGNQGILENMTKELYHRGPDDKGFFIEANIGLGHRRLSIIDLSPGGHQPMASNDKNVEVIFNGEIYNFRELRKELGGQYQFKTQSDTEVIIALYQQLGTKLFTKLNGMFAIAIYDRQKQLLILARDRLGKKPMYWGIFDGTFIFGSELKIFKKHPKFKAVIDLESLNKYLQYEYVPTPHSIFKGVFKLEPGHFLTYKEKEVTKEKFWDISFSQSKLSFADALDKFDEHLNRSVKQRLVSDVPLGIFLSGGIDSSTIAYYAKINSEQKIKTFSIGFKEASFDESKYARQVAGFLGTEHHEQILSAQDSLNFIPGIADLLDEPLADASIVPTYLLSKFTREHVTVALGGDGGDELLCGYDTLIADRVAHLYEKLPNFLHSALASLVNALPTSFDNISLDFKAKKFVSGFDVDKKYRNHVWLGAFDKEARAKLFKSDSWQQLKSVNEFADIDNYIKSLNSKDYYKNLINLYLRTYMMDDILVKVDRASMFNSLEVRAPMLDWKLVDFVNSLPLDYKFRGLNTKYILKQLMADKLPIEIVKRKKKGFGIPLAQWLSSELKPLAQELLSKESLAKHGLFEHKYVSKLLDDHWNRRRDNRKLIWTLMVWQMWYQKWFNN